MPFFEMLPFETEHSPTPKDLETLTESEFFCDKTKNRTPH